MARIEPETKNQVRHPDLEPVVYRTAAMKPEEEKVGK
jgi:hypothetical protein